MYPVTPSLSKTGRMRTFGYPTATLLFLTAAMSSGVAGAPPTVEIQQPAAGAAAILETDSIIVQFEDDEPLSDQGLSLLLNGSWPQRGGIAISRMDEGRQLRVELAFTLTVNEDYVFEAIVEDAEGLTNSARIYFDTFDPNRIVIEAGGLQLPVGPVHR